MNRLTMAIVAALTATSAAATDAGTCYTITDQDHRTACLAKAHQDPARCYAIQDQQLRAECRAEAGK